MAGGGFGRVRRRRMGRAESSDGVVRSPAWLSESVVADGGSILATAGASPISGDERSGWGVAAVASSVPPATVMYNKSPGGTCPGSVTTAAFR